jgi:hypothetical protein
MTEDWVAGLFKQLTEMRREIGRAQGLIEAANVKMDIIQRQTRVILTAVLMLGVVLAIDLFATGVVLAVLQFHR